MILPPDWSQQSPGILTRKVAELFELQAVKLGPRRWSFNFLGFQSTRTYEHPDTACRQADKALLQFAETIGRAGQALVDALEVLRELTKAAELAAMTNRKEPDYLTKARKRGRVFLAERVGDST